MLVDKLEELDNKQKTVKIVQSPHQVIVIAKKRMIKQIPVILAMGNLVERPVAK